MGRNDITNAELDPDLLSRAQETLAHYVPEGRRSGAWSISRIERRRSVVFRVANGKGEGAAILYYKVHRARDAGGSHKLSEQLARASRLTDRLLALTSGTGIAIPRVLAVDPARLTVVTLGIPGRPLTSLRFPRLARQGGITVTRRFKLIGRAIRLVERATEEGEEEVQFDINDYLRRVDLRLQGAIDGEPELALRLRSLISDLLEATPARGELIYAHGDLSPTNILASDETVGLIDFSWAARFQSFDLAVLCYRMTGVSPLWRRRQMRATKAIVSGYYSESAGQVSSHAFNLSNAYIMIRALSSAKPSVRSEARRELRSFLDHYALMDVEDSGPRHKTPFSWWWETNQPHTQ